MNFKKIISIVLGIAIIALFVFKLRSNKETAKNKVYHYDKSSPIKVKTETLKISEINPELTFSGTFEPDKETKVSSEIQGKINIVTVDVGSVVSKGQTLIMIDNALLQLQLQAVEVQIEGLEADVKRFSILAKAEAIQGVQLEKAELGLKSAKVQKATLLEQINKSTVKSPFSGIITVKFTEQGAFAAPGVPLLQISDLSILKFTINVSENDLKYFKINEKYTISSDVYPELTLSGTTTMTGSKANAGNSFQVQFAVKNTYDFKIKSGMFGKIKFKNGDNEKGILIPASAIVGSENQPQVYVVKNGKAVLQNITVSGKIRNEALISKGLKAGDVIVTEGLINLFDQANVINN